MNKFVASLFSYELISFIAVFLGVETARAKFADGSQWFRFFINYSITNNSCWHPNSQGSCCCFCLVCGTLIIRMWN